MNETIPTILGIRPILQRGQEPFSEIMRAASLLAAGEEMVLLAPFEPLPLLGVLGQQGYECESRLDRETDTWSISIRRSAPGAEGREMDARMLEDQSALERVLEECATLGRDETLVVLTREFPSALIDTLPAHGFEGESERATTGHWITRIWRNTHL
jgi:uncharacterized protein (DUF2249 family)